MSRMPRAGGRYVTPIDIAGASVTPEIEHGKYTLTANTLYYFVLGGADAPFVGVHLTAYTAAMIITSATIQDSDHHGGPVSLPGDVSDFSSVAGDWIPETPTTAYVGFVGAGWSQTNGVVASLGSALGGAKWHVAESGAFRTRLAVQVGATGGVVRVSAHGKD